jgi:hypothetical protein
MRIPQRTEEGALVIPAMSGFLEVLLDKITSDAVERHVAGLLTFTRNPQMPDAATLMHEIPHGELTQFLTAESMVEQGGKDGPISNALERFLGGGDKQFTRLVVGEGRGLSFVRFGERRARR